MRCMEHCPCRHGLVLVNNSCSPCSSRVQVGSAILGKLTSTAIKVGVHYFCLCQPVKNLSKKHHWLARGIAEKASVDELENPALGPLLCYSRQSEFTEAALLRGPLPEKQRSTSAGRQCSCNSETLFLSDSFLSQDVVKRPQLAH